MRRATKIVVALMLVLALGACGSVPDNMKDGILRSYSVSKAAARDWGRADPGGSPLMTPEQVQKFLDLNEAAWEAVIVYHDLKPVPKGWEEK